MGEFRQLIERARADHDRLLGTFLDRHAADLDTLSKTCARALRDGGKLLLFGNGGSAADAQHLAAEFVNRLAIERSGLPAIALTTDGSILTSIANDSDFRYVFSRQVEALGRPGDVAIAFTTSGRSLNVVEALRTADRLGLTTAVFSGRDGGPAAEVANLALTVPGDVTARIQEVQAFAAHVLCGWTETLWLRRPETGRPTSGGC